MKVGFIGLGNMGGSVARNIQRAGFDLTVHDLRKEAAHLPVITTLPFGWRSV